MCKFDQIEHAGHVLLDKDNTKLTESQQDEKSGKMGKVIKLRKVIKVKWNVPFSKRYIYY